MKSLILTWSNFQDQEVIYPYYRLKEEGEVHVVADVIGKFFGIMGVNMTSHFDTKYFTEHYNDFLNNYDFLVLPGGVKALEKLRQEKTIIKFISDWNNKGKIIASTCHGVYLMISAKITKDKRISGYFSTEDDVNNSGAIYVNEPVVIDKNIISSPHYDHMAIWLKTAIETYKAKS